jgi:WD40 repeat protein
VRALDVNAFRYYELLDASDESGVSAIDAESAGPGGLDAGVVFWCGTYNTGSIFQFDTRMKAGGVGSLNFLRDAHAKKVTAVSCCPGRPYVLSSGTDGLLKIWDARRLPHHTASRSKASPAPLAEAKHGGSATSAFFAPTGRRVVSTSSDNNVRVWEVKPEGALAGGGSGGSAAGGEGSGPLIEPPLRLAHNNHTGRWLSNFRTLFDPSNDDTLIIGGMERTLDLYSISRKAWVARKPHELVTAVPTINAPHPSGSVNAVMSGTASGRMYLWS